MTELIPRADDVYYRKLHEARGVIPLSNFLSFVPSGAIPLLLEFQKRLNLRFEGGFHAIPEHLKHVKKILVSDWLPYVSKQEEVKIGILGVADVPEFNEKVKLVSRIARGKILKDKLGFTVLDKREAVLEDVRFATKRSSIETETIGVDLLESNYQDKFHLGLAHLTPDFSDDPVRLARNCFDLIEPGGMLVTVTRQQEVVSELSKLGEVKGKVVWASDIFFGNKETACVIVKKV